MVEDEVVASQLKALLTPAITAQENYYRQLGLSRQNSQLTVNGSGGINLTVARRGRSHGADKNVSEGRFSLV